MIAKLVTYDKDRISAIQKMRQAIADYTIEGVATTLPFGDFVCQHDAFRSGDFDTHFVKQYYSPELLEAEQREEAEVAALVALQQYLAQQEQLQVPADGSGKWRRRRG
jgi:acetyl/propionyl-CoA carboxylase alpha subunit